MPHLKELHASKKDQGLVLIGIHSTKGGEAMEAYVKDKEIDYPVAIDSDGATMKSYGGNSYPDYFLIDRKGILRFADLANSQLDAAVDLLLAEEAPEEAKADEAAPARDEAPAEEAPASPPGE
ncbi:MAG: TlpA family protein disulfide reductase [Akkermansiaceae bacterium]|nr:TlpA family protein disulfide reductase [Akkermansiaceae bacterium]